ncbi:MAG: 5'/3'-nucleotidase SurE [Acidobacteriota bacterium]|nr:5'/3'-nucleotidase SurE [Acidobacteriota bacterium]
MTRLLIRSAAACVAALFVLFPATIPVNGQAPYRILLTNDDGIRAPGLAAMAEALKPLGEVTIIAPSENHSGTGHGISLSDAIYVDRVEVAGLQATSLTATPASCVRVALSTLLSTKPDLVVSGVNRGSNFGLNAYISGTVAAAREAAMQGVPAIASSLDISGHPNYGPAAAATAQVVAIVKTGGLPKGVFLNVNVPAGAEFKGLKLARQSEQMGTERFEETKTPYGRRVLWSFFQQPAGAEPGSDVQAALDGFVAITPLAASEFSQPAFDVLQKRIR